MNNHDDVIKWKHFPRLSYWPFMLGIHRSSVNFPHKSQWRGTLMFSLICAWVNNREAGDLRRHRAHCYVTGMIVIQNQYKITALVLFMCYIWRLQFVHTPISHLLNIPVVYVETSSFRFNIDISLYIISGWLYCRAGALPRLHVYVALTNVAGLHQ